MNTCHIDDYVEHFYYGKGRIIEIYRNTNQANIRFNQPTDGMMTRILDLNNVHKLF